MNNEPISYGSAAYLKKELALKTQALNDYRIESKERLKDLAIEVELAESLYRMAAQVHLDIPRLMQALRYVAIRDPQAYDKKHPEDLEVIEDAIDWFAGIRRSQYISCLTGRFYGVKNYAGFYHQRCDCEYGMGPRHGSIVFAIGLDQRVRDELKRTPEYKRPEATHMANCLPQQIRDNCIYFLEAFKLGKIEPAAIIHYHPNRVPDQRIPMQKPTPTEEENVK